MLSITGLNAYYGKSHILFDVHLSVQENEIVSILGRNGMGKTTTLKTIMGEVIPQGSIQFKGRQIAGLRTYEIARLGIGYVPEGRAIFPNLTVRQNLNIGIKVVGKASRWSMEDMFNLFPILRTRAEVDGTNLSGGEQQMLTICRSLMGDPDLIMIDEPTEGLAPKVVRVLEDMFGEIRKRGISILLVEQKLTITLRLSNRLYVMGHGQMVFEGTTKEFLADEQIRKKWIEV